MVTLAMTKLENGISCATWNEIVQKYDKCNTALQSPRMDVTSAAELERGPNLPRPRRDETS